MSNNHYQLNKTVGDKEVDRSYVNLYRGTRKYVTQRCDTNDIDDCVHN